MNTNSRKFSLKDLDPYFGVNPDSEEAGRLRASQVGSISKTTPFMVLAKISCAFFVYFTFYKEPAASYLLYWLAALCILSVLSLNHIYQNRKRGPIFTASTAAYTKTTKATIISGTLWALMPIMLFPYIAVEDRVVIIAVMSGLIGGGAMSLYVIPRAMITWILLLTTGCAIGLLLVPTPPNIIVLCLLILYSLALIRAGYTMAKKFTTSTLKGFELSNQSETIGLLLKDFSENASDWLWEINSTGQFTRGIEGFFKVLHVDFTSISPGDYQGNFLGEDNQILNMRSVDLLRKKYMDQESFREIIISSSGSKSIKWVSLSGKPLYNENNEFKGFRGVASDITEKKLAEERIAYLAHNDALTGLLNRENYTRALQALLAKPDNVQAWSVFYLDLDGFKAVNDTYGHAMGDKLLGEVAKELKKTVSEQDMVARLGGDEFAILCRSAGTVVSVSNLADAILKALCKSYLIDNVALDIGVSIGISLSSKDGSDVNTLMNNADLALYRAKEEGRGTFRLYEHHMDEIVKERRSLEADLKTALKNNELSLAYQPLISVKETRTVCFEALARWTHPERGNVSPEDFIPIAESLGVITNIGDWVINQACMEAMTWPSDVSVAVNLSPQQFQSSKIVETIINALSASGLPPNRLELEITEGIFMDNSKAVLFSLRELKAMGVSISLDDFGTGYSSLSYLLNFPFDKMKIDRSLIQSLGNDPNAENVIKAITKLASVMNLTVTAEGIETLDQVKVLSKMHCTHFQGFLFGKPLANNDLRNYIMNEFGLDIKATKTQNTNTQNFDNKNVKAQITAA